MNKSIKPPKLRLPADNFKFLLKKPDNTQALKEFFMGNPHYEGHIVSHLHSLSKTYHSLSKIDRSADEKDFFLTLCKPAHDSYDDLYNEINDGYLPHLHDYLNAHENLIQAQTEIQVWMQVKAIFSESLDLSDENFIEVIRKARERIDSMVKGRKLPKQDDLSKAIREILLQQKKENGKFPTWRDVLQNLENNYPVVIQEIDYDGEMVHWISKKGKEKKTSFKQIPERITRLKKKIIE